MNSKGFWCGVLVLLALPAAAQVPADTAGRQERPVGWPLVSEGRVLSDTLPARLPLLQLTDWLGNVPGSFVYAFRLLGWPEGWSPWGVPPHLVGLRFDGRPFTDLLTGRPLYEGLPLFFLDPVRLGQGLGGAPVTVYTAMRAYDTPRPLTELRYRTGGDGLQSIMALHAQNRRQALGGRPGLLQVAFGYGGHAIQGAYPGSRLRRGRQVLLRLRYQQVNWTLELLELYNRGQVGAHGGVLPHVGGPFESIYEPFGASVRYPSARRQTIRNDLGLTLRARTGLAASPLALTAYGINQRFRYFNPELDTLAATATHYGIFVQQPLLGITWRVEAEIKRLRQVNTDQRTTFQLVGTDTLQLGSWRLALRGQMRFQAGQANLDAALQWQQTNGPVRPWLQVGLDHPEAPMIARTGLKALVASGASQEGGRIIQLQSGLQTASAPLGLLVEVFMQRRDGVPDVYAVGAADTVHFAVPAQPIWQSGLAFRLDWRKATHRGLYAHLQPTLFRMLNASASTLHRRQAEALPKFLVQVRWGTRMLLFEEVQTDAYLVGHFWTSFRSRTLHAPTGLLALPDVDARRFGPSGILDLFIEANLRSAKLFLVWENITSGTMLQAGTLWVPVYPLPARRLRFGVYWPIWD